jgi:phosphopantothenoylcysteine decarboxylase/phosphopantothenate--cysteine ligase
MGSDTNRVHLVTASGVESWPLLSKSDVALRLRAKIAQFFGRVA